MKLNKTHLNSLLFINASLDIKQLVNKDLSYDIENFDFKTLLIIYTFNSSHNSNILLKELEWKIADFENAEEITNTIHSSCTRSIKRLLMEELISTEKVKIVHSDGKPRPLQTAINLTEEGFNLLHDISGTHKGMIDIYKDKLNLR